jgi:hypothetical protein
MVQYRTVLHRTEADFHRFDQTPSQAHERGVHAASLIEHDRHWQIPVPQA